jgi:hypothetical protein
VKHAMQVPPLKGLSHEMDWASDDMNGYCRSRTEKGGQLQVFDYICSSCFTKIFVEFLAVNAKTQLVYNNVDGVELLIFSLLPIDQEG